MNCCQVSECWRVVKLLCCCVKVGNKRLAVANVDDRRLGDRSRRARPGIPSTISLFSTTTERGGSCDVSS